MRRIQVTLEPRDVLDRTDSLSTVLWESVGWPPGAVERVAVRSFDLALSNHVFCITCEGQSVIVRIFGSNASSACVDRVTENIVFERLGLSGVAPRLLGIFLNGRVEEFLDGYLPIQTLDAMKRCSDSIAQALARFHQQATKALESVDGLALETLGGRIRRWKAAVEALALEVGWVRDGLLKLDVDEILGGFGDCQEVVLHGDLQALNIVVVDESMASDDDVRFLDFEYIVRGPAAFDIGNHFAEWSWSGDYSVLAYRAGRCPGPDEKRRFCWLYLEERQRRSGVELEVELEVELDALLGQCEACMRLSHYHWSLWGVLEGARRRGEWNYMEYGRQRFLAISET